MSSNQPTVPAPSTLRFKIGGDHSNYHCGCAAVIDCLRGELLRGGTVHEDDSYDCYILNGEGTMHHNSPGFRGKMKTIERELSKGKKVYLINTVWQENPNEYDHLLRALSGIVVREQMSHDDLLSRHGIPSIIRLDLSYHAPVDDTAPHTDLNGRAAITDFWVPQFGTFMRHTEAFEKVPYLDMRAMSWSSLVNTLRTGSVLITGRHHAVFAACRARIPFVALEGNTHKIQGLIRTSGLPIPVCHNPRDLERQVDWARMNRALYDELFWWMDEQPRFTLADLNLPGC